MIYLLLTSLFYSGVYYNQFPPDSSSIMLYVITDEHHLIIHRRKELESVRDKCRGFISVEDGVVIWASPRSDNNRVLFFSYQGFPGLELYFWPNHNLRAIIFTLHKKDKNGLDLFNLADNRLFLFDEKGEIEVFMKFKKGGFIKERINYYDGDTCSSEEILQQMVYWTPWNHEFVGKRGIARDTIK